MAVKRCGPEIAIKTPGIYQFVTRQSVKSNRGAVSIRRLTPLCLISKHKRESSRQGPSYCISAIHDESALRADTLLLMGLLCSPFVHTLSGCLPHRGRRCFMSLAIRAASLKGSRTPHLLDGLVLHQPFLRRCNRQVAAAALARCQKITEEVAITSMPLCYWRARNSVKLVLERASVPPRCWCQCKPT